ncbi:MAG TPA: cupin domain-containing protein [Myxococcota bacterium]|nr:cupin domain-containing protein [Myxococcota bacterium]
MPTPEPPSVFHFEKVAWDDPTSSALDPKAPGMRDLARTARASGARRKKIVRGECGFFLNRSVMPAGFRVPPHHHDHDELIVVLSGGCSFDDGLAELGPGDSIVIRADTHYGFTCGGAGMDFLTIRTGEARVAIEK